MDTGVDNWKLGQRNQTAIQSLCKLSKLRSMLFSDLGPAPLLPDLELDTFVLPCGAVDLSNRYILLRAWDATATVLDGEPVNAIQAFLVSKLEHGDLPIGWHPCYICWACL